MNVAGSCLLVALIVPLPTVPLLRAHAAQPAARELTRLWSVPGPWTGLVTDDRSRTIYAVGRGGRTVAVDVTGRIERELQLADDPALSIRFARLPDAALLTFGVWGDDLRAYDLNGTVRWTYPRATGIDDVWVADLDGDESDEVIVGYNGRTGLHVLDGTGKVRWTSAAIGNVWHVCAGDVQGDGSAQVVTTSGAGTVHVFSGDGKRRVDIRTSLYANMVRVAGLRATDTAATMIVGGQGNSRTGTRSTVVAAIVGDGGTKWSLDLGNDRIQSAELATTRPWLALGIAGRVHVVDATNGAAIGQIDGQVSAQVSWAATENDGPPLLVVATGTALNAFRVPLE